MALPAKRLGDDEAYTSESVLGKRAGLRGLMPGTGYPGESEASGDEVDAENRCRRQEARARAFGMSVPLFCGGAGVRTACGNYEGWPSIIVIGSRSGREPVANSPEL